MDILLTRYQDMHNSMSHWKPCAEKDKFVKLIIDLELKIKNTITYPDGMTVLEYAKKLAMTKKSTVNVVEEDGYWLVELKER